MQTSSPGAYLDFARFGALRERAGSDEQQALAEIGDEFEALFVDMMLKTAREAESDDGLFSSNAMSGYREMFDRQIAMTLARSSDLGIGRVLIEQYRARLAAASPDLQSPAAAELPAPSGADDATLFVNRLRPHATAAARELGVPADALLAQAALESGWGAHVIRHGDGQSSHNYFGIKADARWRGPTVEVPTTEYVDGRATTVRAAFRSYATPAAAFSDYVAFVRDNARYADALAGGRSASDYVHALADAGYATDPAYGDKIDAILTRGLPGAMVNRGDATH